MALTQLQQFGQKVYEALSPPQKSGQFDYLSLHQSYRQALETAVKSIVTTTGTTVPTSTVWYNTVVAETPGTSH